jgi:hypothetical protein
MRPLRSRRHAAHEMGRTLAQARAARPIASPQDASVSLGGARPRSACLIRSQPPSRPARPRKSMQVLRVAGSNEPMHRAASRLAPTRSPSSRGRAGRALVGTCPIAGGGLRMPCERIRRAEAGAGAVGATIQSCSDTMRPTAAAGRGHGPFHGPRDGLSEQGVCKPPPAMAPYRLAPCRRAAAPALAGRAGVGLGLGRGAARPLEHLARQGARLVGDLDAAQHAGEFLDAR